jgi:phosphatidylserine/phosphatidylglycerophosphate/cardiolipin synthase-like enzyme
MLAAGLVGFGLLGFDRAAISETPAEITGIRQVKPCFVPGQDCQAIVVGVIDRVEREVFLQAYSFTSAPIAQALVRAKARGVQVTAVLDKSQRHEHFSMAMALREAGIPVWIDEKPAIAHNKVIVADRQITITGSFNFTKSAQTRNAENLVVIDDARVARAYTDNIERRIALSVSFE